MDDIMTEEGQNNNRSLRNAATGVTGTPGIRAHRGLAALSLAALGVVFGDIGTSPLYALRECFHGEYGISVSHDNILGVLSLMLWALIIIVSLKYLTFILRADNNGEGGVLALTALLQRQGQRLRGARWILIAAGLFAASLLYGDGMITPAISVLSAVEGIRVITPAFQTYVIPATVLILVVLFILQHRGTAHIGRLFGPVILLWFSVLAVLGLLEVIQHPGILEAVIPYYGMKFLFQNGTHGFLVLGAVFLVVTGAEALYADLGHFGTRPIRLTWLTVALPSLILNYFGQGAILLFNPEHAHHPFYALVPSWALIPMVVLATVATIIASQAVITGAFSLTRQAIQLGYLPRLRVFHTSSSHIGQIYVPSVNWLLMLATVGLVFGFQSSSKLAAAYGVAVTSTMLVTTLVFYVVARERWHWSRLTAGSLTALFLIVDLAFWSANIGKILHGAWFPLVIGGAVFLILVTWRRGRTMLSARYRAHSVPWEDFQKSLVEAPPERVPGQAAFLTGNPDVVPSSLLHNLSHNKVLHSEIILLHFATEDVPRVPNASKVEVTKLGDGFTRIVAHYGFMESPVISNVLSLAGEQGPRFDLDKLSYFLGREKILPVRRAGMALWRKKLFVFMSRNALDASTFYDIPTNRIIEVGVQLKL